MKIRRHLLRASGSAALACATSLGQAQTYLSRALKLILPYAIRQGTDIAAGCVGEKLSKALNKPPFIDNRPGAGGNLGMQMAAKSPADGDTLLIGTNATHGANAFLHTNPDLDPKGDFEPIGMLGLLPLVYTTAATSPGNTIQDRVRAARAKPKRCSARKCRTNCSRWASTRSPGQAPRPLCLQKRKSEAPDHPRLFDVQLRSLPAFHFS